MSGIMINETRLWLGHFIPSQYRMRAFFSYPTGHSSLLPTTADTIGLEVVEKNSRHDKAIEFFKDYAVLAFGGDTTLMLQSLVASRAGGADVGMIAHHLPGRHVVAQNLWNIFVDDDAMRNHDDRYSYIRFSNKERSVAVFDKDGHAPPSGMLACIPMRHVDEFVDIVEPGGRRYRAPVLRQAIYLLIRSFSKYDPNWLGSVYITPSPVENIPDDLRASIVITIKSALDVSRTTGETFEWGEAPPEARPIGLAFDATISVVRKGRDGEDIEVVEVPLVGDVVLPVSGEDEDEAVFPAPCIVASMIDVRYPNRRAFVVFSEDIPLRLVDDSDDGRSFLVSRIASAFRDGIDAMLVRTEEEDEDRAIERLSSGDVLVEFPYGISTAENWTLTDQVIGRLARAVVQHRIPLSGSIVLIPFQPFESLWRVCIDPAELPEGVPIIRVSIDE